MKSKTRPIEWSRIWTLAPALCFLLVCMADLPAFAQEDLGKYFTTQSNVVEGHPEISAVIISGPPTPPKGYVRPTLPSLPAANVAAGTNILSGVPAFSWSYGCSATSAAMAAGYYDRNGYPNMYTGPTNNGVMPLDNSSWADSVISGETRHNCPLSATKQDLDGRTTRGHVDDYWIQYESTVQDPFITNGWTEHTHADCTGDFMGTNQSNRSNTDGSTTFFSYQDGSILTCDEIAGFGVSDRSGAYGLKEFYESRGYTVSSCFNQMTYPNSVEPSNTTGFTFDDYKAAIDAGHPVIIQVQGHTMLGVGYEDSTQTVYLHDTWDYTTHSMTWGGSYSGMAMLMVTVVDIADAPAPTPASDMTGAMNLLLD